MQTTHRRSLHSSLAILVLAGTCSAADNTPPADPGLQAADLRIPDTYPSKPVKTVFSSAIQQSDIVEVRFNKGLTIRERNGLLTDLATGVLADPAVAAVLAKYAVNVLNVHNPMNPAAAGAVAKVGPWERMHELDEGVLARMCATAEKNLGIPLADLNLAFFLHLAPGTDVGAVCDELNALGIVEMAEPHQKAMALPTAPDLTADQQYGFTHADNGINAFGARALLGGTASDVRICDIEYGFNGAHADLPGVSIIRGPISAASNDAMNNHGTAVLGEMVAMNNNEGTVGLALGATPLFASHSPNGNYNLAAAISTATANLAAGDVILLEVQVAGPNFTGQPEGSQVGLVACDWVRSAYDAIRVAIGNGIHVVEAAGNGGQNLDLPVYSQGNGGHYPFLLQNDSGAIIVGAGASGYSAGGARTRLSFSCYGNRVNVQGWGENVATLGYGTAYANEGPNRFYTRLFNGTSSASPIVASAVGIVESVYENAWGTTLTPHTMRLYLGAMGQPQPPADALATHIGPLPDVLATLNQFMPRPTNDDCEGAIDLSLSGFGRIGSTLGASPTVYQSASCVYTAGMSDVWYRVVAPFDGGLNVTTCGTNDYAVQDAGIDTVLSIYDGGCGGTELACSDDTLSYFCGEDHGGIRDARAFASIHAGQVVYVRVTNPVGARPGPFIIAADFYGAHDACENALDVTNTPTIRAGMRGMTGMAGTQVCTGAMDAADAWHRFTACTDGVVRFSTCGTNDAYGVDNGLDTVLSVYDGCGGTMLACNDDATDIANCGIADVGARRDSVIDFPTQSGHTYYVRVADYFARTNKDYILNTYFVVGNDTCRDGTLIDEGTIEYNTSCATDDGYTESYCPGSITYGKDLWYKYFVAVAETITIDTCGSGFDTKLAVYGACWDGNNAPTLRACNDDVCGLGSRVDIAANLYDLLYIRVGGYGASSGPGVLTITGGREHCAADFNRDGGVDGSDVVAFFEEWEAGEPAADVNRDGGIDGSDVDSFFEVWEAGGC